MDYILELVRYGFHGVAVAMLILGYRLLKGVLKEQSQITSEIALSGLKLRLKGVKAFLVVSLVFFVLGVGSELFRRSQEKLQENEVTILLQPEFSTISNKNLVPILRMDKVDKKDSEPPGPILLSINKETSALHVSVRDGEKLYVQFHNLIKELERLVDVRNEKLARDKEGGIKDGI